MVQAGGVIIYALFTLGYLAEVYLSFFQLKHIPADAHQSQTLHYRTTLSAGIIGSIACCIHAVSFAVEDYGLWDISGDINKLEAFPGTFIFHIFLRQLMETYAGVHVAAQSTSLFKYLTKVHVAVPIFLIFIFDLVCLAVAMTLNVSYFKSIGMLPLLIMVVAFVVIGVSLLTTISNDIKKTARDMAKMTGSEAGNKGLMQKYRAFRRTSIIYCFSGSVLAACVLYVTLGDAKSGQTAWHPNEQLPGLGGTAFAFVIDAICVLVWGLMVKSKWLSRATVQPKAADGKSTKKSKGMNATVASAASASVVASKMSKADAASKIQNASKLDADAV